jgi:hypothetical protein
MEQSNIQKCKVKHNGIDKIGEIIDQRLDKVKVQIIGSSCLPTWYEKTEIKRIWVALVLALSLISCSEDHINYDKYKIVIGKVYKLDGIESPFSVGINNREQCPENDLLYKWDSKVWNNVKEGDFYEWVEPAGLRGCIVLRSYKYQVSKVQVYLYHDDIMIDSVDIEREQYRVLVKNAN